MAAEIGHYALILSFLIALAQSVVPLVGAQRGDRHFMRFAETSATGQCIFIALAFASLSYCFVTTDVSLASVAANSNSALPVLYRFAAVWGNHEGSMLLWVLILALFGGAVAWRGAALPEGLRARALAVQGMIGAGFLAFILFTSNPFTRLHPAPADGNDLNPLLQDLGLAIHPPFLYLGYVGFSMAFSFAVAALIEGRVDATWARWVRPWVLAAWCFLTIGITLGSFWAYYELGWGGWWFWDPVENASFMPWLSGTALLHSALVMERRQALLKWTVLLSILTFSLSLVGTFLVRSGVLTSVHAFTQDPGRGLGVLLLLGIASGGALALFAARAETLKQGGLFSPVSRESTLIVNNILLAAATGTVFLGTFYPLVIDLIGDDKISVGPPYYNITFVPIMVPLVFVMAIGPLMKWKRGTIREALAKLRLAGAAAILTFVAVSVLSTGRHVLAGAALGLAVWLVAGSLAALFHRVRLGKVAISRSVALARTTPRSVHGLVIAHAGMGIAIAGITVMSAWQAEHIQAMKPGETATLGGYQFTLVSVTHPAGPNYQTERGLLEVRRAGRTVTRLTTERRFYPVRGMQTSEAGIYSTGLLNLYAAIGEPDGQGAWAIRLYYHPLAPWIWIGPLVMALGGFMSLTDRRFRVGAPRPRLRPGSVEAEAAPA